MKQISRLLDEVMYVGMACFYLALAFYFTYSLLFTTEGHTLSVDRKISGSFGIICLVALSAFSTINMQKEIIKQWARLISVLIPFGAIHYFIYAVFGYSTLIVFLIAEGLFFTYEFYDDIKKFFKN